MSHITTRLGKPPPDPADSQRRTPQTAGHRGPGGPPSLAIAGIGADVSKTLRAAPGVQQLPIKAMALFVRPDFLSAAECQGLIDMIDANAQPSDLYGSKEDVSYRTSYSCNVDRWDPLVLEIDTRICALTGIDARHGETLQGQRYTQGQEFKPHHDFFHVDQAYWPAQEAHAGQRTWTVMIYLNQPEGGGETAFKHAKISIAPRVGLLLAWNNCGPDGAPNLETTHAGLPVTAGAKYIVTKWYRERPWI
ncbi:prolyl hydroxylase family protein [Sphingobium boeckii]|uniref:Prolyl 4-hydroxylase n=1 Tax=Sphingobium boeckii TaxID=1082345 RepID=A0A7W9ALC2_9SPHN|nr:2OG-Fe(II) oxygenase [Sphingobium boeckii]MBB5687534.1 prolyl 4-hydroxylase [Sphingobium boeckii]